MTESAERFDAEYDIALRFGMHTSFRQRLFEHVGKTYDAQEGTELRNTPAQEASKLPRASWMAETAQVNSDLLGGLGYASPGEKPPVAPPLLAEDTLHQSEG